MFFVLGWSIFRCLILGRTGAKSFIFNYKIYNVFLGIRDQFCGGAAALWRSPLRFGIVEEAVLKLC
jgi:hypothetical protein